MPADAPAELTIKPAKPAATATPPRLTLAPLRIERNLQHEPRRDKDRLPGRAELLAGKDGPPAAQTWADRPMPGAARVPSVDDRHQPSIGGNNEHPHTGRHSGSGRA